MTGMTTDKKRANLSRLTLFFCDQLPAINGMIDALFAQQKLTFADHINGVFRDVDNHIAIYNFSLAR